MSLSLRTLFPVLPLLSTSYFPIRLLYLRMFVSISEADTIMIVLAVCFLGCNACIAFQNVNIPNRILAGIKPLNTLTVKI
ncbi:hypothetical protein BD779DRAFT_973915 [Infundibulicybe gibba]|nr:hypothetical protein BD779DRAFT_973915 [Infundibulicybe gibba]